MRVIMFRASEEEYKKILLWKAMHMNRAWKNILLDIHNRVIEGKVKTTPVVKTKRTRKFRTIMFKCTDEEHRRLMELKEMFANPSWIDLLLHFADTNI